MADRVRGGGLAAVPACVLGRRAGRDDGAAAEARRRRASCKIPGEARHREKWRLALDMPGEITGPVAAGGWGLLARPVVADAGYGEITAFRLGLEARGLEARAWSAWSPCGPPPARIPPAPRWRCCLAPRRDLNLTKSY